MPERLLAIHVQPGLHRPHARDGMGEIGGGDHDPVEPAGVDQLAEVVVGLRGGILLLRHAERAVIDIAQGDDILARDAAEVVPPPPAGPDDAEVQLLIGRADLRGIRVSVTG
jgi:hypothetical protein